MLRARSSTPTSSLLALVLTAVTGCEIDMSLGELGDTSTSTTTATTAAGEASTSSSASASSATSSGADETSSDGGTTSSGTGASSSDTGEATGTAEACLPLPESSSIYVDMDVEQPDPDVYEVVVEADCVVTSVIVRANLRAYTLECDEGLGMPVPHELEVRRNSGPPPPDLPMAVGTPVHLQLAKDYPIDSGGFTYVVVRDAAGELVLAWYGGGNVPGDLGVDLEAWFAPLEVALAFGDCEPEPYEEPGNMFIIDPCPAVETRLALDFQLGDEGIHLLDGTSGQLGPLTLLVTRALHLEPVEDCGFEGDTFSFVAHRTR